MTKIGGMVGRTCSSNHWGCHWKGHGLEESDALHMANPRARLEHAQMRLSLKNKFKICM
jgi:hypothetical protein